MCSRGGGRGVSAGKPKCRQARFWEVDSKNAVVVWGGGECVTALSGVFEGGLVV